MRHTLTYVPLMTDFLGYLGPPYLSDVNYGRSLLQNCNKRGLVLLRYVKKILERLFFTKKRAKNCNIFVLFGMIYNHGDWRHPVLEDKSTFNSTSLELNYLDMLVIQKIRFFFVLVIANL